jgi:hypothetical protein
MSQCTDHILEGGRKIEAVLPYAWYEVMEKMCNKKMVVVLHEIV